MIFLQMSKNFKNKKIKEVTYFGWRNARMHSSATFTVVTVLM